jgi:hypothetical protein
MVSSVRLLALSFFHIEHIDLFIMVLEAVPLARNAQPPSSLTTGSDSTFCRTLTNAEIQMAVQDKELKKLIIAIRKGRDLLDLPSHNSHNDIDSSGAEPARALARAWIVQHLLYSAGRIRQITVGAPNSPDVEWRPYESTVARAARRSNGIKTEVTTCKIEENPANSAMHDKLDHGATSQQYKPVRQYRKVQATKKPHASAAEITKLVNKNKELEEKLHATTLLASIAQADDHHTERSSSDSSSDEESDGSSSDEESAAPMERAVPSPSAGFPAGFFTDSTSLKSFENETSCESFVANKGRQLCIIKAFTPCASLENEIDVLDIVRANPSTYTVRVHDGIAMLRSPPRPSFSTEFIRGVSLRYMLNRANSGRKSSKTEPLSLHTSPMHERIVIALEVVRAGRHLQTLNIQHSELRPAIIMVSSSAVYAAAMKKNLLHGVDAGAEDGRSHLLDGFAPNEYRVGLPEPSLGNIPRVAVTDFGGSKRMGIDAIGDVAPRVSESCYSERFIFASLRCEGGEERFKVEFDQQYLDSQAAFAIGVMVFDIIRGCAMVPSNAQGLSSTQHSAGVFARMFKHTLRAGLTVPSVVGTLMHTDEELIDAVPVFEEHLEHGDWGCGPKPPDGFVFDNRKAADFLNVHSSLRDLLVDSTRMYLSADRVAELRPIPNLAALEDGLVAVQRALRQMDSTAKMRDHYQLAIVESDGDGNCIYHSFAQQIRLAAKSNPVLLSDLNKPLGPQATDGKLMELLTGHKSGPDALRLAACDYMDAHCEQFQGLDKLGSGVYTIGAREESAKAEVALLRVPTAEGRTNWRCTAGDYVLHALCHLFSVTLTVIESSSSDINADGIIDPCKSRVPPVRIFVYKVPEHYHGTKPLPDAQSHIVSRCLPQGMTYAPILPLSVHVLNSKLDWPAMAARIKKHPNLAGGAKVEIRALGAPFSKVGEPCQLGLFTKKKFPAGAELLLYGGIRRHEDEYGRGEHAGKENTEREKSHARRIPGTDYVLDGLPYANMCARVIPLTQAALDALPSLPASTFLPCGSYGADAIRRWFQTPKGFMANSSLNPDPQHTAEADRNDNTDLRKQGKMLGVHELEGECQALVVRTALNKGQEVLCWYNSVASDAFAVPCNK